MEPETSLSDDDFVIVASCVALAIIPTLIVLSRAVAWVGRRVVRCPRWCNVHRQVVPGSLLGGDISQQRAVSENLSRPPSGQSLPTAKTVSVAGGAKAAVTTGLQSSSSRVAMDPRVTLEVYLFMQSNWGFYLDAANSILSMSSCVLFVVDTYRDPENPEGSSVWTEIEDGVEIFFGSYFALDYLFRLYLAGDRLRHYFTPMALIDLITLLPFALRLTIGTRLSGEERGVRVLRMLRIVRMARVLRIFRLERSFSGLSQLVFRIALTLLCLVFCAAGFFWVFETAEDVEGSVSPNDLPFHRVVYYCLIETVGRPRIPIGTMTGHFVLYALVIASAVLIPRQVASLLEAMRTDSIYRRTAVPSRGWSSEGTAKRHVLVTGNVGFSLMHDFLFQFYHQDHGVATHNIHIVLIAPDYPSNELRMLMRHPLFEKRVIYLQGSVNMAADLLRARVHEAAGCFVLAQKMAQVPEQEDLQNIATVLTLKNHQPNLPIYVELLVRRNEHYLYGLPSWNKATDSALCIVEMSNQLVARSALHPGLSTLLSNMFASQHLDEDVSEAWLAEYNWGRSHEVYIVELTPYWTGCRWGQIQVHLYDRFAVVAIAIYQTDSATGELVVTLSPGCGHLVRSGDRACVLALDESHADQISTEARSVHAEDLRMDHLRSRLGGWVRRPAFVHRDDTAASLRMQRLSLARSASLTAGGGMHKSGDVVDGNETATVAVARPRSGTRPSIFASALGLRRGVSTPALSLHARYERRRSAPNVPSAAAGQLEPVNVRPAPQDKSLALQEEAQCALRASKDPSHFDAEMTSPPIVENSTRSSPLSHRRQRVPQVAEEGQNPAADSGLDGGAGGGALARVTSLRRSQTMGAMAVHTPAEEGLEGHYVQDSGAHAARRARRGSDEAADAGAIGGDAGRHSPGVREGHGSQGGGSASDGGGNVGLSAPCSAEPRGARMPLATETLEPGDTGSDGRKDSGQRMTAPSSSNTPLPPIHAGEEHVPPESGQQARAGWQKVRQNLAKVLQMPLFDRGGTGSRVACELTLEKHVETWAEMQEVAARYAIGGDLSQMLEEQRDVISRRGVLGSAAWRAGGEGSGGRRVGFRLKSKTVQLGFRAVPREELARQPLLLSRHVLIVSERWHAGVETICRTLAHNEYEARTVVVLCKSSPDTLLVERLKRFPDVRWVQGTALAADDLHECAIQQAAAVLILSAGPDQQGPAPDSLSSMKTAVMQDSSAVLATLGIRTTIGAAPAPFIVTLLNDGSNVRFFDVRIDGSASVVETGGRRWADAVLRKANSTAKLISLSDVASVARAKRTKLTGAAAAVGAATAGPGPGTGDAAVLENAAACPPTVAADMGEGTSLGRDARLATADEDSEQSGTASLRPPPSPHASSFGDRRVTPGTAAARADVVAAAAARSHFNGATLMSGTIDASGDFAAGRVFSPPLLDKLLSEAFYHPHSVKLMQQLIEGDYANERLLYRIPVEPEFAGQTWRQLFVHLTEHNYSPVAMYRTATTATGNPVTYVYTNPLADTEVRDTDQVFVIGPPRLLSQPLSPAAPDEDFTPLGTPVGNNPRPISSLRRVAPKSKCTGRPESGAQGAEVAEGGGSSGRDSVRSPCCTVRFAGLGER